MRSRGIVKQNKLSFGSRDKQICIINMIFALYYDMHMLIICTLIIIYIYIYGVCHPYCANSVHVIDVCYVYVMFKLCICLLVGCWSFTSSNI